MALRVYTFLIRQVSLILTNLLYFSFLGTMGEVDTPSAFRTSSTPSGLDPMPAPFPDYPSLLASLRGYPMNLVSSVCPSLASQPAGRTSAAVDGPWVTSSSSSVATQGTPQHNFRRWVRREYLWVNSSIALYRQACCSLVQHGEF